MDDHLSRLPLEDGDESAVISMAAILYVELYSASRNLNSNGIGSRRRALAGACVQAVARSFGIENLNDKEGRLADAVRNSSKNPGSVKETLRRLAIIRTERSAHILEKEMQETLDTLRNARQQQKEAEELAKAARIKRDAMCRETGLISSAAELEKLTALAAAAQEAANQADAQLEKARCRCAVAAEEMAQAASRAQCYADAAAAAEAAAKAADQATLAHNTHFYNKVSQFADNSKIRAEQSSLEALRQARHHEQRHLDSILAECAHTEARLAELQLQLRRNHTLLRCRDDLHSSFDSTVFTRRRRQSTSLSTTARQPDTSGVFCDNTTKGVVPPRTGSVFSFF